MMFFLAQGYRVIAPNYGAVLESYAKAQEAAIERQGVAADAPPGPSAMRASRRATRHNQIAHEDLQPVHSG